MKFSITYQRKWNQVKVIYSITTMYFQVISLIVINRKCFSRPRSNIQLKIFWKRLHKSQLNFQDLVEYCRRQWRDENEFTEKAVTEKYFSFYNCVSTSLWNSYKSWRGEVSFFESMKELLNRSPLPCLRWVGIVSHTPKSKLFPVGY